MQPSTSRRSRFLQPLHHGCIVFLVVCLALAASVLAHHKTSSRFGTRVQGVGDVNNDGYSDLVVVGRQVEQQGPDAHKKAVAPNRVYIYYGSAQGMDDRPDVVLMGEMVADHFGDALSAGDVNNDGIPDVIIGAYKSNAGGVDAGRVYIYYGNDTGIADTPSLILTGQTAGERFGLSLASGSDVNQDGRVDLIVGGRQILATGERRGKAVVFFGAEDGLQPTPALVLLGDEHDDQFGWTLSLGDINGDATADIVVGAPLHDAGGRNAGRVYLYLGGPRIDASPDMILTGNKQNALFGYAVDGAADLNGDSMADIVIGAPHSYHEEPLTGSIFIYYGSEHIVAGEADVTFIGQTAYGQFGRTIETGDINHDGLADVVVGLGAAFQMDSVAIYYGRHGSLDGTAYGLLIRDTASTQFGFSLDVTDMTNDGIADVVVGAPVHEGGSGSGKVYIYHGSAISPESTVYTLLTQKGAHTLTADQRGEAHKAAIPEAKTSEAHSGSRSASGVQLLGQLNPHSPARYSDIWGYARDGREYALLGVQTGLSIIDVTDPTRPVEVAFIPGPFSNWRDVKTHDTYAYVTTEGLDTSTGMQIINLSQLPERATLVNTYTQTFSTAHNIYIRDGYAYVSGAQPVFGAPPGSLRILALTDPVHPVEVGVYAAHGYVHDAYVKHDIGYFAMGEGESFDIVDLSDKANPVLLAQASYPFGIYAHQCWTTDDDRFLLCDDEFNVVDLLVFDIRDVQNIQTHTPFNLSSSIIHNVFIDANVAHVSYYTAGYVALDVTDPTQPVQLGSYDTFSGADNIFDGAWGVYPYAPSGTIYVSDISSGLSILSLEDGTCPDCSEPVPPCSDCSEPEACNLEPCIDCEHYSGMLEGPGTYDWHPNGTYYFSLFSGIHQGWLVGPTGADFDLELYQWNGFAWTKVDQSNSTASCEIISYSGSSGYYAWRIVSSSGRDRYDFWLDRPFGIFP